MIKTSDRPPILVFLMAFLSLLAAALMLAALSPDPEHAGDKPVVSDIRSASIVAKGVGGSEGAGTTSNR